MRRLAAFTLIELLVVITIIVVLISLLAPAMDKAIYRAELVMCSGGNLKVMASGVTTYAMSNKRYYPDRGIAAMEYRNTGNQNPLPINPQTLKRFSVQYDIRPQLSPLFSVNKVCQCPLSPRIELENYDPTYEDVGLDASYAMFWAWQYKSGATAAGNFGQTSSSSYQGSFKLGQAFEYDDLFSPNVDQRVSLTVLAGDIDLVWGGGNGNAIQEARPAQTSHPDRDPSTNTQLKAEAQWFIERVSVGRWWGPRERGLLDVSFVFQDGSAATYDGVTPVTLPTDDKRRDRRMAKVPINFNNYNDRGNNVDKMHVPLR